MDHPTPRNREEILRRIEEGRASIEEALSSLTAAQCVAPDAASGWSVKDHLAHILESRAVVGLT